jgi:DNA-3-methyladenine glycosylase II
MRAADGANVRQRLDLERCTFEIQPVPPFRLDRTVSALRRRPINAIDRWDGRAYRRVLLLEERPFGIEVVQVAPPESATLRVAVSGSPLRPCAGPAVIAALTRLLGFDRCLADFYRAANDDPLLGRLAHDFRGLKPPRFPSLFEALVNAFACQQVTLTLGIHLLNRLAETYGASLEQDGVRAFAFPSPGDLVACEPDRLRALGFSRQKAAAIIELARALAEHRLDLDELEDLDDAAAVDRLRALRGVGRWTAEYALLRGLGRLHVFPGDDIGARNNLQRWLGLLEPLDYDGVRCALGGWAPIQGLVYLHLLLRGLQLGSGKMSCRSV